MPEHIPSDSIPQFIAKALRECLERYPVGPLSMDSGSLWENGDEENFHSTLREEFLGCEVIDRARA